MDLVTHHNLFVIYLNAILLETVLLAVPFHFYLILYPFILNLTNHIKNPIQLSASSTKTVRFTTSVVSLPTLIKDINSYEFAIKSCDL